MSGASSVLEIVWTSTNSRERDHQMALDMEVQKNIALKICGITKVDQAQAIADMGVKAIGVIGVKSSARFVEEKKRREIFTELTTCSPKTEKVWVIADMNDADLHSGLKGRGSPSIVQLHGNESNEKCAK